MQLPGPGSGIPSDKERRPLVSKKNSDQELVDRVYEVLAEPDAWLDLVRSFSTNYTDVLDSSRHDEFTGLTEKVQTRFGLIRHHFDRVMAIFGRLDADEMFPDTPATIVSETSIVLKVDQSGLIIHASDLARSTLKIAVGDNVDAMPLDADSRSMLKRHISSGPKQLKPGQLGIVPIHLEKGAAPLLFSVFAEQNLTGGSVFLLNGLEVGWDDELGAVVGDTFQLTDAERGILRAVVEGQSLTAVAQARGRSVETVRTQTRSLFAKTGMHSQIDLVRMYMMISRLHTQKQSAISLAFSRYGMRTEMLEVEPGREVQVDLLGPDDGLPVFLMHGFVSGTRFPNSTNKIIHDLGLKIIAPWRPGYAGSPPAKCSFHDFPMQVVKDAQRVMAHYAVERTVLVGRFSGALYAAAAANKLGSAIAGLCLISPTPPTRSRRHLDTIKVETRTFAYSARYFPQALPVLMHSLLQAVGRSDAETFFAKWYSEPEIDLVQARRPEIYRLIAEGWRNTMRRGSDAYIIDARHAAHDWSAYLQDLNCPSLLIHGDIDPTTLIEHAREMTEYTPGLALDEISGGGQLICYSHPEQVFGRIARMARNLLQG